MRSNDTEVRTVTGCQPGPLRCGRPIADSFLAAAEIGLREHDRLALARTMMERKLEGRRPAAGLCLSRESAIEALAAPA